MFVSFLASYVHKLQICNSYTDKNTWVTDYYNIIISLTNIEEQKYVKNPKLTAGASPDTPVKVPLTLCVLYLNVRVLFVKEFLSCVFVARCKTHVLMIAFNIFPQEFFPPTHFWSHPQVAIKGTAVFGASVLPLLFRPGGCHLYKIQKQRCTLSLPTHCTSDI